ncbi:cell division protein FtsA [Candidatus Nomurabacteria bacterium]|nr:cell division protein FtsA [Candidatus Nomurabacteria bacterium]
MIRNISIGIDVGTKTTRVVVGEYEKNKKNPKIIGIGESETSGLRHGYVVDTPQAVASVKSAVAMAEKTSGVKIRRAFVSLGGASLRGDFSSGSIIISKADSEVTNLDISKSIDSAEDNLHLTNRKVIHTFPISFKLDGKEVLGRLEGMRGNKLEVRALFVTYSIPHLEDLMEVINKAGVEIIDVNASPLAGSYLALSTKQKIAGGALVDIGSETVSLSVFENGSLVSLQTFTIGGEDITKDIALGLKTSLEKAEEFKLGNTSGEYPKKKLDEIISARLSDIFELLENHLKKIKRSQLLPAGLVFIGGGANIANLTELSKSSMKLPAKIGTTEIFGGIKTKLSDPAWFNVLGLLFLGKNNENYDNSSIMGFFKDFKSTVKSSIKQLMP